MQEGLFEHLFPEIAASRTTSPYQSAGSPSPFGQADSRILTARAGRSTLRPRQMSSSGIISPYLAKSTVTPAALSPANSICFIGQLTVEHGTTVMLQALPDSTRRTAAYPVKLRIDLGGLQPSVVGPRTLTLSGPAFDNSQWCRENGEWEIYMRDADGDEGGWHFICNSPRGSFGAANGVPLIPRAPSKHIQSHPSLLDFMWESVQVAAIFQARCSAFSLLHWPSKLIQR